MARKLVKETAPILSSETPVSTGHTKTHRTVRAKAGAAKPEPVAAAAVAPVAPVLPAVAPVLPAREAIAKLAYRFWLERGCQGGSPVEDWARAERELLAR